MTLAGVAAPLLLLVGLQSAPTAAGAGAAGPAAVNSGAGRDFTARPLTPAGRVGDAGKASSSQLAESSPGLLRRDDARLARVMIKLDYDAVASYQGGVQGVRATSPSVTGRSLTGRSAVERDYVSYIQSQERAVVSELREVVPSAEVGRRLRVPPRFVERIEGGVNVSK